MADDAVTAEQMLARSIRYHRDIRLRMTAKDLAEKIAELGGSLSRQAISKIETEGRGVSIDELMYLARAMKMSPLLLLFPTGTVTDRIPAALNVGGTTMTTWDAARWFSGEGYPAEDVNEHWAVPLYLHREHDRRLTSLLEAMATQLFAPEADGLEEQRARAEHEIRRIRGEMRRHGLTPPQLDADLQFIDQKPQQYLTADEVEAQVSEGKTIRLVDDARPGRGKVMRPGDAQRLQQQIGAGAKLLFEEGNEEGKA